MRLKIWDKIFLQDFDPEKRYEIQIVDWNDKSLNWKIIQTLSFEHKESWEKGMIICMPNKWEKIELIVQKLTEIWVDDIIFWPSERSVIKNWNKNKEERIKKIVKEAVEQSWWWKIPQIRFIDNLNQIRLNWELIVFDKKDSAKFKLDSDLNKWNYGLVWPEWWLTQKDYGNLKSFDYKIQGLWETILRTETASILAWWIVKNIFLD